MSKLRKLLLQASPHLIWGLVISLGYSMLLYAFQSLEISDASQTMLLYYGQGLLLIVPLIVFSLAVKKAKHIWQFVLVSVLMVGALHLLLQSWFFTVVTATICLLRAGNRIHQQLQMLEEELPQPSFLDTPSKFLLCLPIFCFLAAGKALWPFFQEMALYHFVAMAILFFVKEGLERFEEYVYLAQMNANVPSKRILETGTRIFVAAALLLVLFLTPVLRTQYTFVPINLDFSAQTEWEEEETEEEEASESGSMMEMLASVSESESIIDLSWLWAIMDRLLLLSFYIITVLCLYRLFKMIIVNFNKTQVEKNDVIESTFQEESQWLGAQRARQRVASLFDFSEAMKIRRRYKRQVKHAKPKPWQSPTEIEALAGKNIPELHAQYENVRYGKENG